MLGNLFCGEICNATHHVPQGNGLLIMHRNVDCFSTIWSAVEASAYLKYQWKGSTYNPNYTVDNDSQ
jgi:hypothetical protein